MSPVTGAWALVVVLVVLPSIAFTSVPDPMWALGIYDELDGDDVVTVVTETAASQVEISYPLRAAVLSEEVLIREAIHVIHFECPGPRMLHSRLPSLRMEAVRAHHDLPRPASATRSHGRTCGIPGDAFRNRIGLGS